PRWHQRQRDRRAQYSDRNPALLRARRRAASQEALLPRRPRRARAARRRRLRARQGQGLTRVFSLVLAVAALAARAAPSERELEQLRGRIEALQTELDQKEAAREEARDDLRVLE